MRSFEQLAQVAYQAHTQELQRRIGVNAPSWERLAKSDRECWIAAVRCLWAEFALVH